MSSRDLEERPPPVPADEHLTPGVLAEEIRYVRERRAAAGSDGPIAGDAEPPDDLVGLALSGGGIRSATFSLGVLQALERWGVFKHVDYLSTVSGGGFIGSALSALMSDRRRPGFPFGAGTPPEDPAATAGRHKPVIEHLRNNSSYLTPKGLLDVAQIVAVLARGILLNLLVLAPWLLLVCAVVTFLYGPQLWEQATNDSYFEQIDRHLASHLDRELEGERPVAAVIRALEMEGLKRPGAKGFEPRVRAWLRGEHQLDGRKLEPLMNSSGLAQVRDAFADGVTRTDVAKRLWQANLGEQQRGRPLLVSLMALAEIEKIVDELALDWKPQETGMPTRFAEALLRIEGMRGPEGARERIRLLYDPSLGRREIFETLKAARLVKCTAGDLECAFAGPEVSPGRAVLELYNAGFFSPRWFEVGSWYVSNWSEADYLRVRFADGHPHDSLNRRLDLRYSVAWDAEQNDVDWLLASLTASPGPLRPGVTPGEVAEVLLAHGLIEPAVGRGRFHFTLDPELRPPPENPIHPRRPASRRALVLSEALAALFRAGYLSEELLSEKAWLREELAKGRERPAPEAEAAAEARYRTPEELAARREALSSIAQQLAVGATAAARPLLARLREAGLLAAGAPADSEELLDLVYLVRWSSLVDGSLSGGRCGEPLPELFSDGLTWGRRAAADPAFASEQDTSEILAALYDLGLLRSAPPGPPDLADLACVGREMRRALGEVFEVERAVRAAGLEEPLTVAALLDKLAAVDGLLRPLSIEINLLRELYDRKVVGLGDTHESYRLVDPDRALWEYLLVLYEGRHFRRSWFEARDREEPLAYAEGAGIRTVQNDLDPFYIRKLRRFDGWRTWSAESFRLPATGRLMTWALWWTLAFPLFVLLGRLFPKRGPATPAGPPSLLRRAASRARLLYERSFAVLVIAILAVAFIEVQPYVVYGYHWTRVRGDVDWSLVLGALSLLAGVLGGPALAFLERFGRRIALVVVGLLGPLLPYAVFLWAMETVVFEGEVDEWAKNVQLLGPLALFLMLVFLGLALGIWLVSQLLDVNSFAFHGFYRDRLARAYLLRRADEAVEPAEELRLSELCPPGSGAPYHLINAALNLQASGDRSLRDRASDFFLFSPRFTGGERTGYCRTSELERIAPDLRLAGAMAVSGAAVTPNMGIYSSGALAPLMALLNIRMGLWVPHPQRVRAAAGHGLLRRLLARLRLHAGPGRLLREIRSGIDDSGALVYLSDGGHLENTGAFELLRRRCRLIVIGDGEADSRHSFGALAALMRYARLDLETEIEIDLAPLRLGADGTCERHVAIGRIRYPATGGRQATAGLLVYVKSSLTGDEDEVVTEYRARQRGFPHESTADQFFNESQFEAYRDLGAHAVDSLFAATRRKLTGRAEVLDWLERQAAPPAGR